MFALSAVNNGTVRKGTRSVLAMSGSPLPPRLLRRRLIAGLAACGLAGAFAVISEGISNAAVVIPSSAIDKPAVDRVVPADAAVNVKTQYGATGNGITDDTAAIQAAINAAIGPGSPKANVYFPSGTYLISQPLEWKKADGTWGAGVSLIGQNRDRSILKLKDAAPGFSNPAASKSMIVTASQNATTDGGGNQAFGNYIFDLTIDVGSSNPGANGIDYLASNRGAIRNVVITAAFGSGHIGISMARNWPGPAMIEDVLIRSFDYAAYLSAYQYGMTFENLRLSTQRIAGIDNINNVISIRRMVSRTSRPSIINGNGALATIIDSSLLNGAAGTSAITNQGATFLRNLAIQGYSTLINDRGTPQNMPANGEYSSSPVMSLTGTTHSLALTVPETPAVPTFAVTDWVGVGAASNLDAIDDTDAIQAALNSGKPVVYLRPGGQFVVSRTLEVPSTVKALVGFNGLIQATTGVFGGTSTAPIFHINGAATDAIAISHLQFRANAGVVDVENVGSRTITLTDMHMVSSPIRGGTTWFFDDVEGGATWTLTTGQRIYARQFNPEQPATKVINSGATLWILGIKTERTGTVVDSRNGASTEILGGFIYPAEPVPAGTPGFSSTDSKQSLSFEVAASSASNRYNPLISTTISDRTMTFPPPSSPGTYNSYVPLYADGY
jgi:hypothetical protein